ncbi:MAG: ClpXP protease specificity-enhancing factor SspB [Alphaproteobacteria bacterium]|nr:ClpXP protease specificity-enhancing factor SspB [Alphaproteobacteria bacterium]
MEEIFHHLNLIVALCFLAGGLVFSYFYKGPTSVFKEQPDWPAIYERYPELKQTLEKKDSERIPAICLKGVTDPSSLKPGQYFYISIRTQDIRTSERLKRSLAKKHPDTFTIALQHEFMIEHSDHSEITITLRFNNIRETLVIPFQAITFFADPSVGFAITYQDRLTSQETLP